MHASAVEHLLPLLLPSFSSHSFPTSPATRSRRVLDIGSGSGYLTHVLAELLLSGSSDAQGGGQVEVVVVGVEHITALRELGEANMRKSAAGRAHLESGRVRFVVGDGRKGWEEEEGGGDGDGWDAIHVGAAAATMHEKLVEQLRRPGRMFIPVVDEGGDGQSVWVVDKDVEGSVERKRLFGVRYVPLTDAPVE